MTVGETRPEPVPGEPPRAPIDFKKAPAGALRILKDPAGSLEALYRPGQDALIQGLIIGGATALLIPLVQAIIAKLAFGFAPGPGPLFKQVLGGFVFLAAAAGLSFALRSTLLRSPSPDLKDDVYLAGSSMLFLLAGTVVGGIFFLFGDTFFMQVARTVSGCGWLLAGFTYYFGLRRVAKADTLPAVWTTVGVLGVATLIGGLLHFSVGPPEPFGLIQGELQRGAQDFMDGLRSFETQFKPPGG